VGGLDIFTPAGILKRRAEGAGRRFAESPFRGEFGGGSGNLAVTLIEARSYGEKIGEFGKKKDFSITPLMGVSGKRGLATPCVMGSYDTSGCIALGRAEAIETGNLALTELSQRLVALP
jgi:hypothetical protein